MVDTHCHLQFSEYDADRELVIKRMEASGISRAIVVGTDVESSALAVKLAEQYPHLYASVGIHPTEVAKSQFHEDIKVLESLLHHPKVVAIGEVGLDYKVFDAQEPNRVLQNECFIELIALANRAKLPVIIHTRFADADLLEIIKTHKINKGGVIHCFDSDYRMAKSVLDLGLNISFTGMITYSKKDQLRHVASRLPHDRVMLETDCPYLPPQSKRGERCEPKDVIETAGVLAELWRQDLAYVDKVTTENAKKLFGI